jgi:hypothetical protein
LVSNPAPRDYLEPNEEAAKWRSSTVARLDEHGDEKGKQYKVKELVSEFSLFVFEKMRYGESVKDAEALMGSGTNLGKHLRTVFEAAISLARLIARQRATFCLEMHDLTRRDKKKPNDSKVTTLGVTGVVVGNSDEEDGDTTGPIMFCATPMLVKWGDGQGRNFDKSSVLVKSFVQIFEKQ